MNEAGQRLASLRANARPVSAAVAAVSLAAENHAVPSDQQPAGGDALPRAIEWLLRQPRRSWETIEMASQKFGLTPLEAAVLFRYFSPNTETYTLEDQ